MTIQSRTASGRLRCRNCGDLAGISRNLCSGCQMAEVRAHIGRRGRGPKAAGQQVQDAYGEAVQSLPPVQRPRTMTGRFLSKGVTLEPTTDAATSSVAVQQLGAFSGQARGPRKGQRA